MFDRGAVDALLTTTRVVRKRPDFDAPVDHDEVCEALAVTVQAPTGTTARHVGTVCLGARSPHPGGDFKPARRAFLEDGYPFSGPWREPIVAHIRDASSGLKSASLKLHVGNFGWSGEYPRCELANQGPLNG